VGNTHWTGIEWENGSKTESKFDANGNKTEYSVYLLIDNELNIYTNVISKYNDQNKLILEEHRKRRNGELVNVKKDEYVYDRNGRDSEIINLIWVDTSWINFTRQVFLYDKKDTLKEILYNEWENNEWQVSYRKVNEFDSDGNKIEEVGLEIIKVD
jgi:hypothetical protein